MHLPTENHPMKKVATLLILMLCFCLSCKDNKAEASPEENATIDANGTVNTNLDRVLLLKLVNQVRATGCNCGATAMPSVPALTWSNQLALAASNHSKDMNKNKFFDHTSSNGMTLGDRVSATGYKWRTIAENIAYGQKDEQAVINSWLNSEGHCKNIMSASYKEMGAAKESIYWTQDFGATF